MRNYVLLDNKWQQAIKQLLQVEYQSLFDRQQVTSESKEKVETYLYSAFISFPSFLVPENK